MGNEAKKTESVQTNFSSQVGSAIVNFESSKLSDLSSVRDKTLELLGALETIKEEMQDAAQLKAAQEGAYHRLLETIERLKEEVGAKHFGLLPEDTLMLEGILKEIQRKKKEAALSQEEVPMPE
jgi:hypothetical protein